MKYGIPRKGWQERCFNLGQAVAFGARLRVIAGDADLHQELPTKYRQAYETMCIIMPDTLTTPIKLDNAQKKETTAGAIVPLKYHFTMQKTVMGDERCLVDNTWYDQSKLIGRRLSADGTWLPVFQPYPALWQEFETKRVVSLAKAVQIARSWEAFEQQFEALMVVIVKDHEETQFQISIRAQQEIDEARRLAKEAAKKAWEEKVAFAKEVERVEWEMSEFIDEFHWVALEIVESESLIEYREFLAEETHAHELDQLVYHFQ